MPAARDFNCAGSLRSAQGVARAKHSAAARAMQSDDADGETDPVRYWSRRVYARACRGRVGVSREMLRATAALGSGGDLRAVAAAVYVKVAAVDTPGDRFYAEDSVCELIAIHLGTLAETADPLRATRSALVPLRGTARATRSSSLRCSILRRSASQNLRSAVAAPHRSAVTAQLRSD